MTRRPPAALRDATDQDLRRHLIATAERLIARRGTAGLTVRQIAQEAKVASGVLYNYFADKEELLALALHAHVRSAAAALPEPAAGGTLESALTAYVTRSVAFHAAIMPAFAGLFAQPGVLTRFAALPQPRSLREELAEFLRAEQRAGRVAAGANPDAAATMIIGACHELVLPRLYGGATEIEVPPGFVADLVATILTGIGS